MDSPQYIRIFRRESPVSVLGPGLRAVIWVQGCAFQCPGCIVPESWDAAGGEAVSIKELAEWLQAQHEIEGLTLSGGEPFQQAAGLAALLRTVRSVRDIGVVSYSGYRIEELRHYGTAAQLELLSMLDLLIDGPYIRSRHADLLWRGSSNQRLLPLTARYRGLIEALEIKAAADRGAGLSITLSNEGFSFTGVPPQPHFREQLEAGLAELGVFIGGRRE